MDDPTKVREQPDLPTAPFGSTGHASTRLLFGAAALGSMDQDAADRTLETVRAAGINHIDTAASYGDSEDRLKPWLAANRSGVFLATKTGERSGDAARAELERSLERMGVDHVDMIQLHNLVEEDEWRTAHGPGGAVAALDRAREEGLVDHVGVTGHGLRIAGMHVRSIAEYPFAAVLFPYNHNLMHDPAYRADVEELMDVCTANSIAMQTIKSVARRRWPADYDGPKRSWYQPLDDGDALRRAVQWVLGDERVFLNTSSDATLLPAIVEAASEASTRPPDEAMLDDEAVGSISPLFDGGELERI